jgi:uncharacterized protein
MISADEIIKKLGLEPLPMEGGYYIQTYRANEMIPKSALPDRYSSNKSFGTAIYYLLTPDTFSALHRLPTDEIFHFYLGDPVTILELYQDGTSKVFTLGSDIQKGQNVQLLVPENTFQGSFLNEGGKYALMGATMAPGFDFSDYEAGIREKLIREYQAHKELIIRLTRN